MNIAFIAAGPVTPVPAGAASAGEINKRVTRALSRLYATTPSARAMDEKAKGILAFPKVVKGGFYSRGVSMTRALSERSALSKSVHSNRFHVVLTPEAVYLVAFMAARRKAIIVSFRSLNGFNKLGLVHLSGINSLAFAIALISSIFIT